MKPLLLTVLSTIGASTLAVVVGCGGVDTGFRNGPGGSSGATETDSTEPGGSSGGGTSGDDAGSSSGDDAGSSSGDDAGSSSGDDGGDAGTRNAFSGAGSYTATTGPTTLKAGHNNFNAQGNPSGRPCLNCHGAGGGATQFTFGGSAFKDAAGTMPAAQVEIRVLDSNGKARSVFTDANGNFFLPLNPNGDLAFPAYAGGRDKNTTKLMNATVANGNCNGCHKAAGAGRIVVP